MAFSNHPGWMVAIILRGLVLPYYLHLFMGNARGSDITCRYGGEEYLLVMPGMTREFAMKRAEDLRQICTQIRISYEGQELGITVSFGVATYPSDGKDLDIIIGWADKALYQSKQNGRDQVTAWM